MKKEIIDTKTYRHSFSSVNKFSKNPSAWLCHYALGIKTPVNAFMTRGTLAEKGAYWLIKRESKMLSIENYEKNIKRLFGKYDTKGIMRERLVLNHIIILNNLFGNEACCRILFFKLEEKYH